MRKQKGDPQSIYHLLKGKVVKVSYCVKNPQVWVETGRLIHANDSFLVLRHLTNRVTFISTKTVLKISELGDESND